MHGSDAMTAAFLHPSWQILRTRRNSWLQKALNVIKYKEIFVAEICILMHEHGGNDCKSFCLANMDTSNITVAVSVHQGQEN